MSYHKIILKVIKFCESCIEIGKQKWRYWKGGVQIIWLDDWELFSFAKYIIIKVYIWLK